MNRHLRVDYDEHRCEVFRGDQQLLVQNAPSAARPFLHPIRLPGMAGVLTQDAPAHHPWQHGLYIGLNDVNGVGFWKEGLGGSPESDGSFSSRIVGTPRAERSAAQWQVATDYLAPEGTRIMHDLQTWSLIAGDRELDIVLRWDLTADRDIRFGQYDYGGLFIRMPYRAEVGGSASDSESRRAPLGRARWAAARMPLPKAEEVATVAILDHPANLEHPVPWRIDNELGIGPSPCAAGPWMLRAGATQSFTYGLVAGDEHLADSKIDARWGQFAKESA